MELGAFIWRVPEICLACVGFTMNWKEKKHLPLLGPSLKTLEVSSGHPVSGCFSSKAYE